MAQQNKAPITAFIGAIAGLITVGIVSPSLSLVGLIGGALIGYALGRQG